MLLTFTLFLIKLSIWLFTSLDILLGLEPRTPLYVTWIFTCLLPVACVPFIKGIEPTQDRTHVLYQLSYNIFKKTLEFFKKVIICFINATMIRHIMYYN